MRPSLSKLFAEPEPLPPLLRAPRIIVRDGSYGVFLPTTPAAVRVWLIERNRTIAIHSGRGSRAILALDGVQVGRDAWSDPASDLATRYVAKYYDGLIALLSPAPWDAGYYCEHAEYADEADAEEEIPY